MLEDKKGLQVRPGRRPVVVSHGVEAQIADIHAVCNNEGVVLHILLVVKGCFGASHDFPDIQTSVLVIILRLFIKLFPM